MLAINYKHAYNTVNELNKTHGVKKMYEWENQIDKNAIENKKHWLRGEIKRISNTTLRVDFVKPDDRQYWVDRLKKLNGELNALEQMAI